MLMEIQKNIQEYSGSKEGIKNLLVEDKLFCFKIPTIVCVVFVLSFLCSMRCTDTNIRGIGRIFEDKLRIQNETWTEKY